MGLLPRIRIPLRRNSISYSCWKNARSFPEKTKLFWQEKVNKVFFCEETLLSSQDNYEYSFGRIPYFKWAYQKNFCFVLHPTIEYSLTDFDWLTLLLWRLTFKKFLAENIFVLFWRLSISLSRISCFECFFFNSHKDCFSFNTENYTKKNHFIWLNDFLTYDQHNIGLLSNCTK